MKTELYLGLYVDKEWMVIAVAEWGRNVQCRIRARSAMICTRAGDRLKTDKREAELSHC